jgi:hypothetical protein
LKNLKRLLKKALRHTTDTINNMATAKQPFIPEPPLEVGIAQYPTPVVPDYVTRDGHIILVEKVSIEKGNYNPQPLDGSVIYDKRDANDWPENLYLVFQQTEPTGKFVFNYWANDRTLASQDPWNYGLQYSLNHSSYPIITRTYITPREDYTAIALGTLDPVFGGNARIAQQEMAELPDDNPLRSRYVQVKRVYETIPSAVIEGKVMAEFGIATESKQVVVAGTSIATPNTNTIKSAISIADAVKSTLDKVEYDTTEILDGYQYDADLGLVVHTTKELIAEGTTPLSPTNGMIAYKDEPLNAWQSIRIRSSISSLPATRTEYKTGAYASPNLLTGFETSFFNFPDGQLQFNVTPVMRAERSYQTTFKYVTSYQYNQPSQPSLTLFDPLSIHVIYSGFFFSIDIPNCLTNSGFLLYVNTGFNNATSDRYGVHEETYNVPVSSTTADQYLNLVGTYQLIAYEVDYWKANIWRIAQQYVLLK